jgi:hypothetical protein
MEMDLVCHPTPALWQYCLRAGDGHLHDVVIYGVPSVFPRGPYCNTGGVEEGPPPLWLRLWGDAFWYEATVDGEWADPAGHAAYATPDDALGAVMDRLRLSRK